MAQKNLRLTKSDIIEMIRFGDVEGLRAAICAGLVKVPEDLVNFKGGDTAFHIAARYGQAEVLKFLAKDLHWQEGDEIKTWGFDASIKNNAGKTARDVASEYGSYLINKRIGIPKEKELKGYMDRFLSAAEITEKSSRDIAVKDIENVIVPEKILPKRKEDFHIPKDNPHRYTGRKDASGNTLDGATLYTQIREEYEKLRAIANKERKERENTKREFLGKAESGTLTEKDIKEYIKGKQNAAGEYVACRIDCKTGRHGDNALHLAIKEGHHEIVKLLVEGVENDAGRRVRVTFDDKARELLSEALAKDPNSKGHRAIEDYLSKPKAAPQRPAGQSLSGSNQLQNTV